MHDLVRGVPGTFDRSKKSLEIIKKERPDIPVTVFATLLIDDNLDSFFKLIDTCKELGLGTINVLLNKFTPKKKLTRPETYLKNFLAGKRMNTD